MFYLKEEKHYNYNMNSEPLLAKLKEQQTVNRDDISELLASIGEPGKKRAQKLAAVQELELKNNQGHHISVSLDSYGAF